MFFAAIEYFGSVLICCSGQPAKVRYVKNKDLTPQTDGSLLERPNG